MPTYQPGGPYVGVSDIAFGPQPVAASPPYAPGSTSVKVASPIFARSATGWSAATVSDTEQTTSPTLTISPADGDVVLVGIMVDKAAGGISAATVTPDQGVWTQVGPVSDSGSPNDHRATWFWRTWTTGDATALTFTCSAAVEWALVGQAWGGVSATTPVGAYAYAWETGTATTSHLTGTITPGGTLSWIGAVFSDRSGSTWTAPTGYTLRASARPGTAPTGISPSVGIVDSNNTVAPNAPVQLTGVSSGSVATHVNFIFELVPYGQTSNPPPQVTVGPWIGAVTDTSVTVTYAFSGLLTSARLVVSTDSSLTVTPIYSSLVAADADGLVKLTATGLTANTAYFIGTEADGVLNTVGRGGFTTLPTAGVATNFSVAFGSCNYTTMTTTAFEAIRTKTGPYGAAKMVIHMGDINYQDWDATDVRSNVITQWFNTLNAPQLKPMIAAIPMTYAWDNHDWGGPNSDKDTAASSIVVSAYRAVVPSYTLPASDNRGCWQTWVIGRVRFIQIDPRSQRNNYLDAESSSKSMLGTEQKAWLKARLLDPEPVKIICGNMFWRSGSPTDDRWGSFSTEFTELNDYIDANNLASRVYILFGDRHALCADDGTGTGRRGRPQAGGAPFQQGSNAASEDWSQPYYDADPATITAFGWLDITDSGGSTITVSFTGITSDDNVVRTSMTTLLATTTGVATATAATGTGTAYDATVAFDFPDAAPDAEVATGTGTANDATALIGAQAEAPAGTGVANTAAVTVAVNAEAPAAAGVANDATPSLAANAESPAGTGTANAATANVAPAAELATGTGTAYDATAALAATAESAAGVGTAYDATASTATATDAPAEVATGTGVAGDATVTLAASAETPTGVGTANDGGPALAVNAESAAGTGVANDATLTLAVNAAAPTGAGTAGDAAVWFAVNAEGPAGVGSAADAAVTVTVGADVAAGVGAANDAAVNLAVGAQPATGVGAAYDATVTAVTLTNAFAEVATGVGVAYDATVIAVGVTTIVPGVYVATTTGATLTAGSSMGALTASSTGPALVATSYP